MAALAELAGQLAAHALGADIAGAEQGIAVGHQLLGGLHRGLGPAQPGLDRPQVAAQLQREANAMRRRVGDGRPQVQHQLLGIAQPALRQAQVVDVDVEVLRVEVCGLEALEHQRPGLGAQAFGVLGACGLGIGDDELVEQLQAVIGITSLALQRRQQRLAAGDDAERRAEGGVQSQPQLQRAQAGGVVIAPEAVRQCDQLVSQRDGDVEAVHVRIGVAHDLEHARVGDRVVGESFRQLGAALLQQLQHIGDVAAVLVGVGAAQQLGQEARDGLALARRGLGFAALPQADGQAGTEGREHQRRADGQGRIAPQPQVGAVAPVLGAHAHRALGQPMFQVVDEAADAGIAFGRLAAHGLGGDGLQVAGGALGVRGPAGAGIVIAAATRTGAGRRCRRSRDAPWRLAMQHRMLQRGAAEAALAEGQLAAGQLVEHDAQRIDVAGDADRLAGDLLGCGIGGRQAPAGDLGQLMVGLLAGVVEQAGDAEVQQLGRAALVEHHIAGLEVAVHDQLGVRMLDGACHLDQQLHACRQRQLLLAHVARQGLAGHVLQHEVGAAVLLAGVQQAGDVRMGQSAEQGALGARSGPSGRVLARSSRSSLMAASPW